MKAKIEVSPIVDETRYPSATYSQIVTLDEMDIIKIIQYINTLVFDRNNPPKSVTSTAIAKA